MRRILAAAATTTLLLTLVACGSDEPGAAPADTDDVTTTSQAAATPEVSVEILGAASPFTQGGGDAEPIEVEVEGRECVLTDALFGSCRGASGAGGDFVVTAESTPDAPTEFSLVVRCGVAPAVPAAFAHGDFQPALTDLGLAAYGHVIGLTLLDGADSVAALVYQPAGATCPVVWGLGPVADTSYFTGGTDALNGSESPIFFTGAGGDPACAVADGQGGITVGAPKGDACA